jgi:hypothetical protein
MNATQKLNKKLEKEFFSLAGVMLKCLHYELHEPGDKVWFMLGYMDYAAEMGLILELQSMANKAV